MPPKPKGGGGGTNGYANGGHLVATRDWAAAVGGERAGQGPKATVSTIAGDRGEAEAARPGQYNGAASSAERSLPWSEAASAGQMARISTGNRSTGHSWDRCVMEEHTKQTPSRSASQHRRTLARTVAGRKVVSQHNAA